MSHNQPPPDDSAGSRWGAEQGSGDLPHYPSAPPPDQGTAGPVPEQPSSIHTAVRLMWAGAVVSLLSLVVTLATLGSLKDQIRDQIEQSNQQVTQSTIDAAYAVGVTFGVVVGLIGVALWLWMAWKNGQGRSWARIVATVLAGINVLSTLFSLLSGSATTAAGILAVVNLVLAVVILVLLWRPESSAYYAARSGRPRYA